MTASYARLTNRKTRSAFTRGRLYPRRFSRQPPRFFWGFARYLRGLLERAAQVPNLSLGDGASTLHEADNQRQLLVGVGFAQLSGALHDGHE